MVFGILCAALFALTLLTLPVKRRIVSHRLRNVASVAHRLLGYGFLALSALHLALSFRLFSQRPLALFLLGFAMTACAALACFSRRIFAGNPKRGQTAHKVCTVLLAILLLAHVSVGLGSFSEYQREMAAVSIAGVDAGCVPDGTYFGSCDVGYIRAKVEVAVQDGRIASIDLVEHKNERGAAGEGVIPRMLERQTTDVDAVSGATNSSRVIQKAVENALGAP